MAETLPLPEPRRLRDPRVVIPAVALAAIVALLGLFALWLLNDPAEDTLIELVPAEADGYVHVFLKPSTQQRLDIEDLVEGVLGSDDAGDDVKDGLEYVLRQVLEPAGLDFEQDVGPWLGKEIAWFRIGNSLDQALIIEVKGEDEGRPLQAAVNRIIPEGVPAVTEVVDGRLIVGTEGALAAVGEVIDGAPALGDDEELVEAREDLPEHRVAFVHIASPRVDAVVSVRPDGLQIDASSIESDATALLGAVRDLFPATLLGVGLSDIPDIPGGPGLTALRIAGAVRPGTEVDSELLGDGYEAKTVIVPAPLVELADTLGLLDSQPWVRAVGERVSRIVVGTGDRADLSRIFIGVQ